MEKQDDIYNQVLKRAKDQLPEIAQEGERFTIPEIDSRVEGNRTYLRNFKELVVAFNRTESHFLKFLTNELGTSGNIEGNRAIFQGKHSKLQIAKLVERYVKDFVLCKECGKPDTRFIQQNRVEMMKCDACGSVSAIRSIG